MNTAFAELRGRALTSRRARTAAGLLVVCAIALLAGAATRFGMVLLATEAAAAIVLVVLSVRWPLIPLVLLVALIPLEDALNFSGVGTLSRAAGILFAVVYAIPRLGRLRLGAMPPAGWAYVGWAALSMLWAISPDVAEKKLETLVQLAAIAVLVADVVVTHPWVVRPLLWTYTVAAALSGAFAIAGYLTGFGSSALRVSAITGQDPAQFAAVLLPALMFSLRELVAGRRVALSFLAAGTCAIAILLSGTRGAWVSAIAVVAVFLLPNLRLRGRLAVLMAGGLLLVIALQVPGAADLVEQRASTATSTGGSGRTDIWAVGLAMFERAPIAGVGYANFPTAYTPALEAAADVTQSRGYERAPHSIIVGTLGELGAVGMACLVLFLTPLLLRRGWGEDALAVQAMLASLIVSALFLDILANRKQVWLVIGIAAGLAYLRDHPVAPAPPLSPATSAPPFGRAAHARPTSGPLSPPTGIGAT